MSYCLPVIALLALGAGVILTIFAAASRRSPGSPELALTEEDLRGTLAILGYRITAEEIADLADPDYDRLWAFARQEWDAAAGRVRLSPPKPEPAFLAARRGAIP
ncbi:MAG: hypothetical protein ACYDCI_00335 [Candidatus Limnocylindrales bacterium]